MNYDYLNIGADTLEHNSKALRDLTNKMSETNKLTTDAKKANIESLEVLKRIEMNTSYLRDIVDLLNTNNEHQKDLNDMVQSILEIAKAPDKKEAQSRYRSVMKKIGDFATVTTSAVNVAQLSSLAINFLQLFIQSH